MMMTRAASRTPLALTLAMLLLQAMGSVATAAPSLWGKRWWGGTNSGPSISGAPVTSSPADAPYRFTPSASDPEGNRLRFAIANKPRWASFSSTTGTLAGTPTAAQVGTYRDIRISVSDGSRSAALAPFSISVTRGSGASANTPPVISGSPVTSATTGSNYSWRPTANDADGDPLAFAITGKPDWAVFSTASGALSGTARAGTYGGIVVSVSDGKSSAALPAFTVTVSAADQGSAVLTWTAPTQNTDGSTLTDLAGYRIYHGTRADSLSQAVQVPGSANTSYSFSGLSSGIHYFAVTAYTSAGRESTRSSTGSKTVP